MSIPGVLIKPTNPKDKRSYSNSLLNLFYIVSSLLHWDFFFFLYKQKLKAICAQMAHPAINMWHLAFFIIARCSLVAFYIDSLPTIVLDNLIILSTIGNMCMNY